MVQIITYNNIVYKIRRFLEEKGIANTLSYIKSLDTIELLGFAKNGKERLLFKELLDEYGYDIIKNDSYAKFLQPCINEGVIKSKTEYGVIYYTHFAVIEETEINYKLIINEYNYNRDAGFYLRYIIVVEDIPKIILDEENVTYRAYTFGLKQFLLEFIEKQELIEYFSPKEIALIKEIADKDDSIIKTEEKAIVHHVLLTFRAVNFLSNHNNSSRKKNNSCSVIAQQDNLLNVDGIRTINLDTYYKMKINENIKKNVVKDNSEVESSRNIIRRTEKWLVKGHTRHYRDGRIVFIEPYYKGPNRNSNKTVKTTFKITE